MNHEQLSSLAKLYAQDECFREAIMEKVRKLPQSLQEDFETMKTLYCLMENSGESRNKVCSEQ